MKSQKRNRREAGFSAFEVIGGAIVLSIFISICGWLLGYVEHVRDVRKANSPFRKQKEQGVKDVHPGDEFGSFVITFQL